MPTSQIGEHITIENSAPGADAVTVTVASKFGHVVAEVTVSRDEHGDVRIEVHDPAVGAPTSFRLGATTPVTVEVVYDTEGDDPLAMSDVHLIHRLPNHLRYVPPDRWDAALEATRAPGVVARWVSVYQHGDIQWSLQGEGAQCRFDTTQRAGVIYYTPGVEADADTHDTRLRGILECYSAWCNGHAYAARNLSVGEEVWVMAIYDEEDLRSALELYDADIVYVGEAADNFR